jgi:hypothetical protein
MMKRREQDPLKLTLSEWQAQEWRAVQPYGTWFSVSFIGGTIFGALYFWLDFSPLVYFTIAIPLCFIAFRSGAKAAEIRKHRDAEQKIAIEKRWKEEDEQLYQQRK